jgi:muramoyltetrapeptide carboxypeptidase
MLTHLWLTGKLDQLAGVVLGKFTDCDPEGGGNSFSLQEIFERRFRPLEIPTLRGLMIGHVEDQTTFPMGIEAELDVDAGKLTLLEAAVK